jgi:hypothetical protein
MVLSEAPAQPKTLGVLASCSRHFHKLLLEMDQQVWKRAFCHSTQHLHTPAVALTDVSSWRELLRDRTPWCSGSVRVLSEHDLQPNQWISWNAIVAVIGSASSDKKALLDRLVHYDEAQAARQASFMYLRRSDFTRSCIVKAFGTCGRLVFVDFDDNDLDLAHRSHGGLENCDAAIVVCDTSDGLDGAASADLLLRRADAVIAESAPASRRAWCLTEGSAPRFLALTGREHKCTREAINSLRLAGRLEELNCEACYVQISDDKGADPVLQVLAWSLIKQSSARHFRLQQTTGHRLLDSRAFLRGRGHDFACARRRVRSE